MADENHEAARQEVHRQSTMPESVTRYVEDDGNTRRRFIQKGAMAVAGAFGALPLMRLAKIDVAMAADDLPGSEDEYLDRLTSALGDRKAAEKAAIQLKLKQHKPLPGSKSNQAAGGTCTCGCDCSCDCSCGCPCQCDGDLCSCICSCGCTCNCGCNCACNCVGQCNCPCDAQNPNASTFNQNSDTAYFQAAETASDSGSQPTSTTNVDNAFGQTGRNQTAAGRNNNALKRSSAALETAIETEKAGTGQSSVNTSDASQGDGNLDVALQPIVAQASFPATGKFGLVALAIGLAGAGWCALRKRVAEASGQQGPHSA